MSTLVTTEPSFSLFSGYIKIATAPLNVLLPKAKAYLESAQDSQLLFFHDETGAQIDFNLQGSVQQILDRVSLANQESPRQLSQSEAPSSGKGRGRPKLGVVSREISLLPRHWQWLESQTGGASATLRKLVEQASKANIKAEARRRATNAAGKFMWAIAGNLSGFEEASRALYAGEIDLLREQISNWPPDVSGHVLNLLAIEAEAAL